MRKIHLQCRIKWQKVTVNTLDILATQHSETEKISIAVVNKEPDKEKKLEICLDENSYARYEVQEYRIVGSSVDSYKILIERKYLLNSFRQRKQVAYIR